MKVNTAFLENLLVNLLMLILRLSFVNYISSFKKYFKDAPETVIYCTRG